MDGTKSLLQSKTFWGAIIAGAAAVLGGLFGFEVTGAEQSAIIDWLAGLGAFVGLVVTIWGRWTAKTRIG